MAKKFDASTKFLLETFPDDWPAYLGTAVGGPIRVVDAELSTVTSDADKVLLVEAPERRLLRVEAQASHDLTLPMRLLRYNVLLDAKFEKPVRSVALLLRREADSPSLTGIYRRRIPGEDVHHEFSYKVVRAWQQPVETILTGGLGTLPLAPISDVSEDDLPGVIRRMEERMDREASPELVGDLWTSTKVLMGLTYEKVLIEQLLRGVRGMKESVTYQAILEEGEARGRAEGRVIEARSTLLRLGERQFGTPPPEVIEAVEATLYIEQLEAMTDRILDASNWQEVLDGDRHG